MLKKLIKDEYDLIAPEWRQKVWVHDTNFKDKIVRFSNIGRINELLDVGIGAGDLASLFDADSVTGIDLSKSMLTECRRLHPKFKLILGDAENLPFEDNSFDAVCCRNLLQNFINPTKAFSEMVRVLKPKGKLVVVESAVYEVDRKYPTAACRVVEPFHPLFPSHEGLRKLFEKYNLRKINQEIFGVHKKWLARWQLSKGATAEQRLEILKVCENYPEWYKLKYDMKFFPEEVEVESTLSFSLLKGEK